MLKLLKSTKIQLLIISLLTVLVYSNTFQNEFVIEDEVYITKWELTQSLSNIPKMFAGDTAPTGNVGIYRPLRGVFYAISYALWGGENPVPYHIQALFVHLLIVILVYLVAQQIFQKNNFSIPFFVALLFGLHPVHTEAVDYLTASFDTIAYIFFFASFYFYLRANNKISLIFAALAFFHFEMTLTLPLMILLYQFTLGKLKPSWSNLKRVSAYFGIALIYLFIRFFLVHMTVRGEYLGGSIYYTFLTMTKVILKYLEWLVFPLNLSINPVLPGGISAWNHPLSHPERIIQQSLFDLPILASILVVILLLFAAFYFYKKIPLITFSIGWFFISLLPVSYIIPQGTIFQERYIYIASFGYIMFAVFLYDFFYQKKEFLKTGLVTILIVITALYGIRTYLRNQDWKDSFTVWSKLASQSPDDVLANFYTANLYKEMANLDQAVLFYQKALAIEPRLHEARFALGEIYFKKGQIDAAATAYQQALLINPQFKQAQDALEKLNKDSKYFWKECQLPHEISFSCPQSFLTTKTQTGIKFKDPKSDFTIDISLDQRIDGESPEDYLKKQTESYGTLINQGLAQIPTADLGFVKSFNDPSTSSGQVQKLKFFLFKEDQVIKILVFPADSEEMVKFDRLVSSLRFTASGEKDQK